MKKVERAVQYFTPEYLEACKSLTPEQIIEFLENFKTLYWNAQTSKSKSRLISIKIPENLLSAFRVQANLEGIAYQTQIKKLMQDWLLKKSS